MGKVQGLAGVVDALVGAAGTAVDEARKTLDVVDEYVTKAAVVLTNVVDVLEGDKSDAAVGEDEPSPFGIGYLIDTLSKNGFNRSYLETLNYDRVRNIYESFTKAKQAYEESSKQDAWSDVTDKPNTKGGPTAAQAAPVEEPTREYMIAYIRANTLRTTDVNGVEIMPLTDGFMSLLSDSEVLQWYNSLKVKVESDDPDVWRNY